MAGQAARDGTVLTVMLFDIDHFKSFNDVYGHAKGDEVLAAVGAVARADLRAGDFIGRYGGEEFVLFAPMTGEEGARQVGEKLRRSLRRVEIEGVDRRITASFGVAGGWGSKGGSARACRGSRRGALSGEGDGPRPGRGCIRRPGRLRRRLRGDGLDASRPLRGADGLGPGIGRGDWETVHAVLH